MTKRLVALSNEASRALNKMASKSGMSADELLTMAIMDLADSGKVLEKSKHEQLVTAVRDALGEHADEYDTDAIARTIGRNGGFYVSDAISFGIQFGVDNHGGRYLSIYNLTIVLDYYEV